MAKTTSKVKIVTPGKPSKTQKTPVRVPVKLSHQILLVIGDNSGDGHEKKEKIIIKSNFTQKEMETAYNIGTKKLKFNIIRNLCAKCEDNEINYELLHQLIELGFKINPKEFYLGDMPTTLEERQELKVKLDYDFFTEIVLFVVKLGRLDFKYKKLILKTDFRWNIGGYGLIDLF